MNPDLGLRVLGEIMDWTDSQAREEFRWLRFMSEYKYDGYREYLAGARFLENLANWLQQFKPADRKIAYAFMRQEIIFFGPAEMQRLIDRFYPAVMEKNLIKSVCTSLGIAPYKFWSSDEAVKEFRWRKRKTLIAGLSDGARIDALRRSNTGILTNEQVVFYNQIDVEKWKDLVKELNSDLKKIDPERKEQLKVDQHFSAVYLIDDFAGSGTTFIRKNNKTGEYKGKLKKFRDNIPDKKTVQVFEEQWELNVHHYIGGEQAVENIQSRYDEAKKAGFEEGSQTVNFTYGYILPKTICLKHGDGRPFSTLCNSYYDTSIEDMHAAEAGDANLRFGYAQCGLPLILEHNTPNNALALLWAESEGKGGAHKMRPLFRRRQRHSEIR